MAYEPIIQIYELKTVGYEPTHEQFTTIAADLEKVRQAKIALLRDGGQFIDKQQLGSVIAAYDAQLKKINETKDAQIKALQQQRESKKVTDDSVSAYAKLSQAYQDAKVNVQEMAAQFGAQSQQAMEAAVAMGVYKDQLQSINLLLKGGITTAQPELIVTPNATEAIIEESAAVKELISNKAELRQAKIQAILDNIAEGKAQVEVAVATEQVAAAVVSVVTPYELYTGTLAANITRQANLKAGIAELSEQLKVLVVDYDAAANGGRTFAESEALLIGQQNKLKVEVTSLNQTIGGQTKYLLADAGSFKQLEQELALAKIGLKGMNGEMLASTAGQRLTGDIQLLDNKLKESSAVIGEHQRNVGNYGNVFTKAYGIIRQLAYILPGIGIAGIIGFLTGPIIDLTKDLLGLEDAEEKVKEAASAMAQALGNSESDIAKVQALAGFITDANNSLDQRKRALAELKEINKAYFGDLVIEGGLYDKITKKVNDYATALILSNVQKARGEDLTKATIEEQDIRSQIADLDELIRKRTDLAIKRKAEIDARNLQDLSGKHELIDFLKNDKVQVDAIVKRTELYGKLSDAQAKSGKLAIDYEGAIKAALTVPLLKDPPKSGADKLNADEKNRLNEIDANMKEEQAKEQKRFSDLRLIHEATYQEEIEHVLKMQAVDVKYLDQKIAYMGSLGKLNAKEKEQLATFEKERSDVLLASQDKIKAINKKEEEENQRRLTEQAAILKNQLDEDIRKINLQNQLAQEDVAGTPTSRAAAKLAADKATLDAQRKYNDQISALEIAQSQRSIKLARETGAAIAKTEEDIRKDQRALALAGIQDIKDSGTRQVTEIETFYANARAAILNNDKLTDEEKQRQLAQLEIAHKRTILSAELAALNIEVAKKKALLAASLISNDEYLKAVEAQAKKAAEVAATTTEPSTGKLADFLNRDIASVKGKDGKQHGVGVTIGEVIKDSYDLAQQAMNAYFDAESQRIQQSKQAGLDKLQQEQDAARARAGSASEQARIDKEYQVKKDALAKEAGEKLKRIKKEELAIQFATELASIAAQAAGNIANSATFGVAGAIQYAILSSVAAARNLVLLGQINRQQFAYGGVPTRGGRFGGRSHSQGGTPFAWQGNSFEAEAQELAIIRTRNAPANVPYQITGTHSQIASMLNSIGGGATFAPGAKLRRFAYGGSLGESLQAPVFIPAMTTARSVEDNSRMLDVLQAQALAIQQVSQQVRTIEVQQVTSTVTNAQKKQVRQNQIGVL